MIVNVVQKRVAGFAREMLLKALNAEEKRTVVDSGAGVITTVDNNDIIKLIEQANQEQTASQLNELRSNFNKAMLMIANKLNDLTEQVNHLSTVIETLQYEGNGASDEGANSDDKEQEEEPQETIKWPQVSMSSGTSAPNKIKNNN